MLCFRLQLNDEKPVVAGAEDLAVLTAIVTSVIGRQELGVSLSGFVTRSPTDHEHLQWLDRPLAPGDRLTIEVVESNVADPPARRDRDDPDSFEREKRTYFERLKKEYEGE